MKSIKVDSKTSIGELLALAREESVLLVSEDGSSFVLEEADDFEREVAQLGNSKKFMRFLAVRSKEKGVISIEQYAKELNSADV